MNSPTKTRRRFTAQQKAEAVELCLQEGLSCNAVAQRLGLPSSSLARWVRQARIDRGQSGPKDQGLLIVSSDIRFWSSGDTKTGPVDGLLMEALWRPLDRCFIGGCRVVVGGGGINAA